MAAEQVAHFDRVRDRLGELDIDVMAAMRPFHAAFNAYHEHTQPKDWLGGPGLDLRRQRLRRRLLP
jgi:hypothetical protein